jgi:transposase-like protein
VSLTLEELEKLEPYCHACGENDKRNLAFDGAYGITNHWKCKICAANFTSLQIVEIDWRIYERG